MEYELYELQHHGVKGMKWGVRKKYEPERTAYKSAKKELRTVGKEYRRKAMTGIGISRIGRAMDAEKKYNSAELKTIDAKAKLNAAKAKNSEKAEFNTYRKEMQKSGLVGSAADANSRGRSTRLYDHIKAEKGKEYADAVQKKVQTVAVAQLATAATVAVGSMFVEAYLTGRG